MKIFIAYLAFMAVAVDAQLEPDPFTSFISNYYNRRQNPQKNYQIYVPSTSNRPRTFISKVTTLAPKTFISYKSSSINPQSYSPYLTSTTTLRPYVDSSTTQIPTTVPPYRPLQTLKETRRPYILSVTTPTRIPTYISPNIASELNKISTVNNPQYITSITAPTPTKFPLYIAPTLANAGTSRAYVPIVTTVAPSSVPIYYAPSPTPQYRPYQTSTTTRRPYFSIVTTPAPATNPLYNTPSNTPNKISATTLRSFIPIAPSTLQPYKPYISPSTVNYNGVDHLANTRRYANEIKEDGSYNWFFETDNGIAAQADGTPKNFGGDPPFIGENVKGAFSWTAPNGEFIDFSYTADENGYHPQGNVIPTPPPLPSHVIRLLEYLSRVAGAKK